MKQYLSAKLDVVFKMLFGDKHNVDILGDFLLTVLDIPKSDVQKITVLNPFVGLDQPEEKKSVMDVKVELAGGRRVNVEIQVRYVPDMVQRLHYYKAKMVTEQLSSGDPYTDIVPTSCVAVLDYRMYEDAYCHHAFRYYDKKRDVEFSGYEDIHILEIPKLEQDNSNPALVDWLRFLNAEKKEEFDMLAEKSEPMKKAVGVLAQLSADEKNRMIAEAREKELRDQMSRERGAERRGVEKVAFNLLNTGMSIEDIAKVTMLDKSDIEALKNKQRTDNKGL